MIDSHCHLDLPDFAEDVDEVIEDAQRVGIERILIPGTSLPGWSRQCSLARVHSILDLALGVHPWFIVGRPLPTETDFLALLDTAPSALVALGEMGLDGAINVPLAEQIQVFELQLRIAQAVKLPVIVHHHKSHHLILQSVKRTKFQQGGVIHAFAGNREVALQYIDAGFLLGVGGTITYPRAHKTREAVRSIPLNALLLETDAPSMPLHGKQGQRNLPRHLAEIAMTLATLKQLPISEVCWQTKTNYYQRFKC